MRLTNIPKLYYGNETYGYGNLLELFPCLEAQASPYLGEAKSQETTEIALLYQNFGLMILLFGGYVILLKMIESVSILERPLASSQSSLIEVAEK